MNIPGQLELLPAEEFNPPVRRYISKDGEKHDVYYIADTLFQSTYNRIRDVYLTTGNALLLQHKGECWAGRSCTPLAISLDREGFQPLIFCSSQYLYYGARDFLSPEDHLGESPFVFEAAAIIAGMTLGEFAGLASYQRSSHIIKAIAQWLSAPDRQEKFESTYLTTQLKPA